MKKIAVHLSILLSALFLVGFITVIPVKADIFVGGDTLTYGDGIDATNIWQNTFTSLEYNVWQRDDGNYLYRYSFTADPGAEAIFIEVSEGTTPENFDFPPSDLLTADGPLYLRDIAGGDLPPSIPNPFGLVLYPEESDLYETFEIISDRAPVYGSFIAARPDDTVVVGCGDRTDHIITDSITTAGVTCEEIPLAYNTGATDPKGAFILRPDTASSVPEPATLLLLGTGLIGTAFLRRKKVT